MSGETSGIATRIDEVIRIGLARSLKAEGYRKSARTFRKAANDSVSIINVQASQGNIGDTGRFTLNLGVYAPDIERLVGRAIVDMPKEYECTIRSRIGSLKSSGKDLWWDLDAHTDVQRLAEEVADLYAKCGKPWMDDLQTVEGIGAYLLRDGPPTLEAAAAALLRGDRERARSLVARVIAESRPAATALRATANRCLRRWKLD